MTRHRIIITGVALMAMMGSLRAQTKSTTQKTKGSVHVESTRMTGVVDWVDGNTLVVKMRPNGDYRVFIVPPDRQFEIDGQIKHIGDIKRGTVLTATVMTTRQPVTVRTTSVLNGTVAWVQGNYVLLRLDNGETREYHVPASFKFVVDGKPASVSELKTRHEGIGHQDRRGAPYGARVEYGRHRHVTQVGAGRAPDCARRVGCGAPCPRSSFTAEKCRNGLRSIVIID